MSTTTPSSTPESSIPSHQPSMNGREADLSSRKPPETNGKTAQSWNGHTNGVHLNGASHEPRLNRPPVAICGIALRLPSGVRDPEAFWDVLVNQKDLRGPIPAERWNAAGYTDKLGSRGAIATQHGYFLDEDLSALDTSFFSLTKRELERCDPQQRQLLEISREVLDSAGEKDFRGKPIGCYVGTFGEDWLHMSVKDDQHVGGYPLAANGDLILANRVSFEYDLKGPSMVIKTGCSASLIGLHEACRALQNGDCSGAIVAGANLVMGPSATAVMAGEGMLSPDGSSKTFDASANGYARGEAINAVYIKLLGDAVRDNNPIRAIIRNTGTNSDGRSQGIMAPNSSAHEALMHKVYADIGLDPCKTAFVECHGTGTPTGDPIETTAVGNVFGEHGVYIGSVKPNVGHSEGASGITSLIKGVLALENSTIPPNIKFSKPNPKIPFEEKKLKVPTKSEDWPAGRDRRVSINSFGIGGSNVHVILEAPEPAHLNGSIQNGTSASHKLIVTSANTSESLKRYMASLQDYVAQNPENTANLAYTLACHRQFLPHRGFMVVKPDGSLAETSSPAKAPNSDLEVIMVFNGQGAQWPEMGKQLYHSDADFKKDLIEMNDILKSLLYPPSWNLQDELFAPPGQTRIHKAELAQPLCTALQLALVRRLKRAGVRPSSVVGHSSGEIAAAYAAGALSLEEAIITAYYRGYVTKLQTRTGGMGAVGLGVQDVSKYIQDGVVIACDNSPSSVTLSGDVDVLDRVLGSIKADNPETLTRRLKVEIAYHSHHMKSLAAQYQELIEPELARKGLKRPVIIGVPFFSSVTGKVVTFGEDLGPDYWVSNLTSRVRFTAAISQALQKFPGSLFVEIGPHSTLSGPLRQISAAVNAEYRYIPTLIRGGDSSHNLLSTIGQLYQKGVSLDWSSIVPKGRVLHNVPRYAWDHTSGSFWYEARLSKESRLREFGHHRLLGLRIPQSSGIEPAWRNNLSLVDEPWLADHKVGADVVFPFAGYVAMAGEAIRQHTRVEEGYRVRQAVASSAMVLSEQPVEVVTTLKPLKSSDATASAWYEFRIVSHNGSSWTQHFEGQIKACTDVLEPASGHAADSLVRQVATNNWYDSMSNAGLVYGPEFQSLKNIVSSTTENLATAQIANESQHADAAFLFHPACLDNCLQLLLVAMTKGLGRNFSQLRVPTAIKDLSIRRSAPVMTAVASGRGLEDLSVEVVADGRVALRLDGLQLTPVDDGSDQQQDPHAAARLEWLPDFDLIDHKTLFSPPRSIPEETRMQEEMTLLCILETADRVRDLKACNWHFEKFRSWLDREISRAKLGMYPILKEDSKAFVELPSATRRSMIEEYYEKLIQISSKGFVAVGLKRIYDSCEAIFTGEVDTLDTLMQDNVLTEIYNAVSFGKGDFFKLLAHARPDLRILEVGAGTGGTTEMILRNLVRPDGLPAYSLYTFSDISAGFFPQAQERFSYAPNMDYRVFDISQNPFDQGFKPNTYDVILAPNVVHATESLHETLSNLQPLLRSGGLLVLTELCAVVRTPNYIFGNFSGWWLGEADERPWEPYVTVDRWEDELKAAGFSGIDTAVLDAEEPNHYCAAIVSTKAENGESREANISTKSLVIVSDNPESSLVKTLTTELEKSSIPTSIYTLSEATTLPSNQDIISLLDLESYFFDNISKERFEAFQTMIKNHESGRIPWLTKPAQVNCEDPRSAQSIGLARAIRSESQIPFYTLEIKPNEPLFAELVRQVLGKIQRTEDTELLAPDKEYIVDEGLGKIGRYQPFIVNKELKETSSTTSITENDLVKTLYALKAGSLEQVAWASEPLPQLGDDAVLIDTRAVGLNSKSKTSHPNSADLDSEILEVAGVVLATGSSVNDLIVGDRVTAIIPKVAFKTKVACPSVRVQKIPHSLSFEDAASVPISFTTAIECLINVGQLERGQTVLIHSAAGGIGRAAIQICQSIGVKIYTTVGNQEQIDFLSKSFNLPQHRIFDVNDDSFVARLQCEMGGRGVDIVLNLASGETIETLWNCVAEFGKMITVGNSHGTMNSLSKNTSHNCVNMAHLAQSRPQRVRAALKKCIELYGAGKVTPGPSSVFETVEVQSAFQEAQDSNCVNSVVIRMPTDSSTLEVTPRHTELHLNNNATYLLTGGMGGLGVGISTWLVEHGVKSLVFLSRSAGQKPKDKAFIRELESCGCSVITVAGRAESMQDVRRAISLAPHPIKGVIHLAMVLRDDPVATMTHQDWEAVSAPKIQGARNLHESLKNHQLDFFVMASSIVTIVEQPGQGNYAAANTFLEAFTQYRRSLSLPASVLNICPIEDVGFVAENSFAKKNIKGQGLYFLREAELLHFLELAIRLSPADSTTTSHSTLTSVEEVEVDHFGKLSHQHPWTSTGQMIMGLRSEGDLNDPNTRTNWRRDRRMGFYHNENHSASTGQQGSSNRLATFLADAADNPSVLDEAASAAFLAQEIGSKVFGLMLKNTEDLDTSLTLQQIGLDSLMAIELRRWWKIAFNLEVSVLELMATGTIEALGAVAAKGLKQKLAGA